MGESTEPGVYCSIDTVPGNFEAIKTDCVANVHYTQGEAFNVKLEGDSNEIDNLSVVVNNGVLELTTKKQRNNHRKVDVFVSAPDLAFFDANGVGNVYLDGDVVFDHKFDLKVNTVGNLSANSINCSELKVRHDGVGNMNIKAKALAIDLDNNTVGDMTSALEADRITVGRYGVGASQLNVDCDELKFTANDCGSTSIDGYATTTDIKKDGVGIVNVRNLKNRK